MEQKRHISIFVSNKIGHFFTPAAWDSTLVNYCLVLRDHCHCIVLEVCIEFAFSPDLAQGPI